MSDVLTVGVRVDPSVHARAVWALEALLAPYDVRWRLASDAEIDAGSAQLGYGCEGTRVTLLHAPDAWHFDELPPAHDDLARAFWWLGRVEELLARQHERAESFDAHGRFTWRSSALRDSGHEAPVDILAARLAERLGVALASWPGQRRAAFALSHDVDVPWRWTRRGVRSAARGIARDLVDLHPGAAARAVADLATVPFERLRGTDPYMTCGAIARLEAQYDARSTFFIIAGHHHPADGDGAAYDAVRAQIVAEVLEGGGEVGVHGSYMASAEPDLLTRERGVLEELVLDAVTVHRFHYLRHDPTRAHGRLWQLGFTVDSSMGYAEQPSFRAGFSYPYRAWDHARGRACDTLVIVPMVLMDATLAEERYLGLAAPDAWQYAQRLLDHALTFGSGCSVLWHNERFAVRAPGGWARYYERLMQHANANDIWLASVGDVAQHWRERLDQRVDRHPQHATLGGA